MHQSADTLNIKTQIVNNYTTLMHIIQNNVIWHFKRLNVTNEKSRVFVYINYLCDLFITMTNDLLYIGIVENNIIGYSVQNPKISNKLQYNL